MGGWGVDDDFFDEELGYEEDDERDADEGHEEPDVAGPFEAAGVGEGEEEAENEGAGRGDVVGVDDEGGDCGVAVDEEGGDSGRPDGLTESEEEEEVAEVFALVIAATENAAAESEIDEGSNDE